MSLSTALPDDGDGDGDGDGAPFDCRSGPGDRLLLLETTHTFANSCAKSVPGRSLDVRWSSIALRRRVRQTPP